jgi:hypothetical protein
MAKKSDVCPISDGSTRGSRQNKSCPKPCEKVMEKEWFYRRAGREDGPLSAEAIREMIATGKLDPSQPVWNRESDCLTFVRAAEVAESREKNDGSHHAYSGG